MEDVKREMEIRTGIASRPTCKPGDEKCNLATRSVDRMLIVRFKTSDEWKTILI